MSAGATNRELLERWQAGDEAAAQILVDRYLVRLTALARARLSRRLARRLDADDVVMSAWRSFFVATGRGRVRVPEDDDLWPVLVTLTLRKLARQAARHHAQQRDLRREHPHDPQRDWINVMAGDPAPDEAATLVDELEYLLAQVSDTDREIVSRRLQGVDPPAIAAACGCSPRTVRRALQRFREVADARRRTETLVPESVSHGAEARTDQTSAGPFPAWSAEPTRRFDELVLEQFIGSGGSGKLYRARDRSLAETVAVKFLRKSLWRDQRAIAALIQETQLVSRLSHPGIVRHFGWGRSPAGAVFVVIEWVDGPDLAEVLREGPLSVQQVRDYGLQVADAVLASHAAGIVHGDLTPSNVLVAPGGRLKLADFGFATLLLDVRQLPRGGTPGFLAPEQISEAFGSVTGRTDVYGFGGLLYALLTGKAPWRGNDLPEVLAGILSSRPPQDISQLRGEVPLPMAELLCDCLQKEPAERPASIQVVRQRLQATNSDVPTTRQ